MTRPDNPTTATLPSAYDLGLVLTGGGARGAYQVGVLRWIARNYPDLQVPIITGVSAGAVNTAKLASHPGTFAQAVDEMTHLWSELTTAQVFDVDVSSLVWNAMRWGGSVSEGSEAWALLALAQPDRQTQVSGGAVSCPARRMCTMK